MRHGLTEMNVYLHTHEYDSKSFKDPMLFDTRLTQSGIEGAKAARAAVERQTPPPEVLVISPLTRALQTASFAYLPWYQGPVVVEPLARERVWLSSDTGRAPAALREEFTDARLSFDGLPDVWWYTGGFSSPAAGVQLEPEGVFQARMAQFWAWLAARPESVIDVVAHWGVINELTGLDFANCEQRDFHLRPEAAPKLVPASKAPTVKQLRAKA